jgi:rhamnulose-1-phosphate aldolase
MRDIAKNPYEYILLLFIPLNGQEYRYLSISKEGIFSISRFTPTSELFTHLAYHNLLNKTGSKNKAVLHAHVTELIALTHIKAFTNETKLNKLLQSMHPEIKMFIPEGVGLVPLMEPGTEKIANATIKSAGKHRLIIWEKHGCFAAGENLSDAFDLIDIIAKAAKIYFLSKKETN